MNRIMKTFVLVLLSLSFVCGPIYAKTTTKSTAMPAMKAPAAPATGMSAKGQIDQFTAIAIGKMRTADSLLKKSRTQATMKDAIKLYSDAALQFETAATGYGALIKNGKATQNDANSAMRLMTYCENSIREVRKHL